MNERAALERAHPLPRKRPAGARDIGDRVGAQSDARQSRLPDQGSADKPHDDAPQGGTTDWCHAGVGPVIGTLTG